MKAPATLADIRSFQDPYQQLPSRFLYIGEKKAWLRSMTNAYSPRLVLAAQVVSESHAQTFRHGPLDAGRPAQNPG
jgi:hypothetical protein